MDFYTESNKRFFKLMEATKPAKPLSPRQIKIAKETKFRDLRNNEGVLSFLMEYEYKTIEEFKINDIKKNMIIGFLSPDGSTGYTATQADGGRALGMHHEYIAKLLCEDNGIKAPMDEWIVGEDEYEGKKVVMMKVDPKIIQDAGKSFLIKFGTFDSIAFFNNSYIGALLKKGYIRFYGNIDADATFMNLHHDHSTNYKPNIYAEQYTHGSPETMAKPIQKFLMNADTEIKSKYIIGVESRPIGSGGDYHDTTSLVIDFIRHGYNAPKLDHDDLARKWLYDRGVDLDSPEYNDGDDDY